MAATSGISMSALKPMPKGFTLLDGGLTRLALPCVGMLMNANFALSLSSTAWPAGPKGSAAAAAFSSELMPSSVGALPGKE